MTTNSITNTNTTESGRIFITGQRTNGLDTSALIEAAYQQKLQPALRLDQKVEENAAKTQGYVELRNFANSLSNSLSALRSVANGETNAFDLKTGSIFSSNGNTNPVTVAIDSSAAVGTFEIEVLSLARRMIVTSGSQASNTDPLGLDGVFSLGVQGGASTNITITNGMSLNNIATAINAESSNNGVTASVVQVAAGEFQLRLSTVDPNQTIETSMVSGTNVMESLGVVTAGGAFVNQVQNPSAAQIRYDGILVTRDTNVFDDLVEGVEININSVDVGNTLTVNIEEDGASIKDAIINFVDTYNILQDFVSSQEALSAVEGAGAEDTAVLFGDNTLRSLTREITSLINGINNSAATTIRDLSNLGIELNALGDLEIDEVKLDQAILTNYDEVRALFESNVTVAGAGNQANIVRNTYNGPSTSFTLDITTDGAGTITGASVGGDNSLFTIDGNRIRGTAGGPYEGLVFAYLGTASVSLDINVNSGFADRLGRTLERYTDTDIGLIQQNILQLDETNANLTADADRIRERAEIYQEQQILKYSQLEAKVTAAQNTLRYLEALLGNYGDD